MAYISLCLKWSFNCGNCGGLLPVNKAAERILCPSCSVENPTPAELWETIVAPQLNEAIGMESGTVTWANGMLGGLGTYSMEYGRMFPRCENGCGTVWAIDDLLAIAGNDTTRFECPGCGKIHTVREAPEFIRKVVPFSQYVVGEESPQAEGTLTGSGEGISIFCYSCGGKLPLDGSSRKITCSYCGHDLLIPDDIWQRLNPVISPHFWYILLDKKNYVGVFPEELDDFIDLEAMPNGDTIILWDNDLEGNLARSDRSGGFLWHTRNFEISDYTRLLYDNAHDYIWVLDSEEHRVYCLSAADGSFVREFIPENEPEHLITANENESMAMCSDGTIIINRIWGENATRFREFKQNKRRKFVPVGKGELTACMMRRFSSEGTRIPLWEGFDETSEPICLDNGFEDLQDRPNMVPDDTALRGGPEGTLYMIHTEEGTIARFDRSGALLGILNPELKGVEAIVDCGIAGNGTIYILYDHKKEIGGYNYTHIGTVSPEGEFTCIVGPHSKINPVPIGTDVARMSVAENGELHIMDYNFDNFRILAPDGSLIWRSAGTVDEDDEMAEELKENRRRYRH